MEEIYGIDVMDKFYVWHGFKKGGTPGGKFTGIYFFLSLPYFFLPNVYYSFGEGKELRRMLNEYHLSELKKHLGGDIADIEIWINYLSCCLKMHTMCVRSKLPEDYSYEQTIQEYKDAFEDVHQLYGVSETLKVHILSGALSNFVALAYSAPSFLPFTFFYFLSLLHDFSTFFCRACPRVLCLHRGDYEAG